MGWERGVATVLYEHFSGAMAIDLKFTFLFSSFFFLCISWSEPCCCSAILFGAPEVVLLGSSHRRIVHSAFLGWWCHLRLLCRPHARNLWHDSREILTGRPSWGGMKVREEVGPPPTIEWNNGIMMMKMAFNLTSCLHHKSRRAAKRKWILRILYTGVYTPFWLISLWNIAHLCREKWVWLKWDALTKTLPLLSIDFPDEWSFGSPGNEKLLSPAYLS